MKNDPPYRHNPLPSHRGVMFSKREYLRLAGVMNNDEIHCPICVEASKQEKSKCNHREPLEIGYGFGRASGWLGIGMTYRCPDCAKTLWFEDDTAEMYPEEKEHNDKKRAENIKYKDWKSE